MDDLICVVVDPEIKKLEAEAINLAESDPKFLPSALNLLEDAIKLCPEGDLGYYPSIYNNKAQILRLMSREQEALSLLNQLLSLPNLPTQVLRQSSAQRAWLLFRAGGQEAAFKDFERAGKLGCGESKRMAVRCNPYAAMCNQMLQEIIQSTYYTGKQNK